jgi:SAM-dependent methyltransferase
MAEVSRVLRPGGVFVASTFLTPFAPLGELVGDAALRPLSQVCLCVRVWCVMRVC